MKTIDQWHVLIVTPENADSEREVTMLHPDGCGVTVSSVDAGAYGRVHYECATQQQIDNAGYYGMFARDDTLEDGIWMVRPWIDKIVGPDWTEWDGGWETQRLVEVAEAPA